MTKQAEAKEKAGRASKNIRLFTDLGIKRLKPPNEGQKLYWDTAQRGLSLLVGPRTKTFRSTFKLNGEWVSRKLGRFGELVVDDDGEENANVAWARERTRKDRILANQGIDPRAPQQNQEPISKSSFEFVVDQFIQQYAKPRQHTWDQTERVLKNNCAIWLKRPIAQIPHADVRTLLQEFIDDGHPYKAAVTRTWLKRLWRWAYNHDHVSTPVIKGVEEIVIDKHRRDRFYSDTEIKLIWNAANKLKAEEEAYIKLLLLLAPRKTALACMKISDLDDTSKPTLWTTPHESTKSRKREQSEKSKKRVYLTPLPPLAQRILKALVKNKTGTDRLFPSLPVHQTKGGRPTYYGIGLRDKLTKNGAPKNFNYHAVRHTVTTWLANNDHSGWEQGLVLNHSHSGVTASYSHGYPLNLKRTLLEKWAEHVESLVQKKGATLLR